MARIGNTVKLVAEFKDFDGNLTDPDTITLRILDNFNRQIGKTIPIGAGYRVSVGKYHYPFVVPEGSGSLTYEFQGYIEGNPCVGRGTLPRNW